MQAEQFDGSMDYEGCEIIERDDNYVSTMSRVGRNETLGLQPHHQLITMVLWIDKIDNVTLWQQHCRKKQTRQSEQSVLDEEWGRASVGCLHILMQPITSEMQSVDRHARFMHMSGNASSRFWGYPHADVCFCLGNWTGRAPV